MGFYPEEKIYAIRFYDCNEYDPELLGDVICELDTSNWDEKEFASNLIYEMDKMNISRICYIQSKHKTLSTLMLQILQHL